MRKFVAIMLLGVCGKLALGAAPPDVPGAAALAADVSAASLYNSANGYARANKPGLAVLYYERARLLDPVDADIETNLRIVRSGASLPQPAPHWYDAPARIARPTILAWVGIAGIVLIGAWLLVPSSSITRRRGLRFVACVGVLAIAAPLAQAMTLWPLVHSGVVITNVAEARASPVNLGDPAFTVPAGELVRITSVYQGYLLVRTIAGRSGWVPAQSIAPIVP